MEYTGLTITVSTKETATVWCGHGNRCNGKDNSASDMM